MTAALVRKMRDADIPAARRIFSLAFGTFTGSDDPERFRADCDYIGTRFRVDPEAAFVAELDGEVVGSNFASNWGSVGFFGPLTIHPDYWDQGLGRALIEPAMDCFERWKVTHAGLYTFPHSTKHVHLYQQFGFRPRFLTAIMSKTTAGAAAGDWSGFSGLPVPERERSLDACFRVTDPIYPGLRLEREIRSVSEQNLGETVLLRERGEVTGFAVCHCGAGTEAGEGRCFVKFGAVKPGAAAAERFSRLLEACEGLAAERDLSQLVAGVNLARHAAYEIMLERGFRSDIQGVTMHRPNEAGYSRSDVYAIDDWR